jgi:sugar/nucleoside kinase (ribokinase family)
MADQWADVRQVISPLEVPVVATTNGAGDAGTAGLLYAIATGAGPAEAAELSVTCAAAVVAGRRTTQAEIKKFRPTLTRLFPGGSQHAEGREPQV